MEENLMEKLLNDFDGVLNEFNNLVANNDIDAVRRVLNEVQRLVAEQEGIKLDDREPEYDHVLHEILDKMTGIVERQRIIGENPELQELKDEKERLLEEKSNLNKEIEELEKGSGEERTITEKVEIEATTIETIQVRIDALRTPLEGEEEASPINLMVADELEKLLDEADEEGRIPLDKVNELISKLRNEREGNQTETTEVELSDEERAALEARNEELQNDIDAATAELKALLVRLDELTDGVDLELKDEVKALLEQRDLYTTNIKDLRKQSRNLEKQINDFDKNLKTKEVKENVLAPMDYTYMGSLSDEEIIRRLLSEELHLDEETINATIGQYSLVMTDEGAHDENGEDNPISNRQLVKTSIVPVYEEIKEPMLDPMDYTYMGRLTDEQIIRRLLSEQLHLDEETINATIDQYSLPMVEDGAHDENGEDEPISKRQLTKTTLVTKEYLEAQKAEIDQEIERLQAEKEEQVTVPLRQKTSALRTAKKEEINRLLAEKNKELDDIKSSFGIDENTDINALIEAMRNEIAEYEAEHEEEDSDIGDRDNRIVSLEQRIRMLESIPGLEAEIAELKDLQSLFRRVSKKKELTDRIASDKEEIAANNIKLQGKEKVVTPVQNTDERNLVLDTTLLELESITSEKTTTYTQTVTRTTRVTEEDQKQIDEKKARIAEIDTRVAEIDKNISNIEVDRLDVGEEAKRIGDHIFKTAEIRRELADRNISREEFLAFYEAGYQMTREQLIQLNEDLNLLKQETRAVIIDEDSDTNLKKQIDEAKKSGNTDLQMELYEKLRKNFIKAGREDQLKQLGLDHEVASQSDLEGMEEFFANYIISYNQAYQKIRESHEELKENSSIFAAEIERINAEKATLDFVDGLTPEEIQARSDARKELRAQLLKASITPEKDLTDEQIELLNEWQDASERFLGKKDTKEFTYIDKNGETKTIEVSSIDDTYPEYAQDVEFLGVPAYKENLEQISAFSKTDDPYVFGEEVGRAFEAAEAQREGAGYEVIDRIMADKQKYVDTFNGIPNPHKVKYENWKTAGSTLKGMKPVDRDLPAPTRAKNFAENVGRFFGIRVPKFSRLNEHGEKVSDVRGGVTTLALDGLVAGAVVASAVTLGPVIPVIGYAAKGIVTAGNRIAARVEYSRHKDEIDGNLPVINQADSNAREVARKEYYREQGDNRFVAWGKAKLDKYFTRQRGKETEEAIVDGLVQKFEESETARIAQIQENVAKANENQHIRQTRQRQVAMGARAYNDIVRDPDAVNMDEATATIARNAALESMRPGKGRETINKSTTEAMRMQYVKDEGPVAATIDIDESALDEADGPISAITSEQIYTGRKQHVDRLNKVLTAVTAAGLKFGYTAWRDGFTRTENVHHDDVYEDQPVHRDAKYEDVTVDETQTQFDTSKTLEELRKNYAGKTADEYYSVSGGLKGQRTEGLADREITAAWFDNKTAWGSGVSDTNGLSAPVLTERLADAGLLDSNGVLRQDITVQQVLDEMGCSNPDLSTLDGIYMSVGDKYWVSLSDLMKDMTKEVVTGSKVEHKLVEEAFDGIDKVLVTPAYDETISTFDPSLIVKSIKDGAIIGAAVGAGDVLHEANQTTYIDGATPGTPKEAMPEASDRFDTMAEKLQKAYVEEKQAKKEQEEAEKAKQEKKNKKPEKEQDDEERD